MKASLASSGTGEVRPLFARSEPPDPDYAREVAHAKRFCELYRGDPGFRAAMDSEPAAAIKGAGLAGEVDDYRALFDSLAWQAHLRNPQSGSRLVRRLLAFHEEKAAWRSSLRNDVRLEHPGLHAWRRRQILRCFGQLPTENAEFIVHAPVCFELCRGCSVGCWFCGISAGRLSEVWSYQDHHQEWRGVLEVLREFLGSGGRLGFCYWGTDPFDNPDYERFCEDYHQVFGSFPHTTTALAHRDVERTRRLLRLSQERGCLLNRFSVLSLGVLKRLHQAFTAEELLYVDMALQNSQSLGSKTRAGKVLARVRLAEQALEEDSAREGVGKAGGGWSTLPTSQAATIACVSGFQFNLVDRRVRLISPCPAGGRWPDGYRVHAEETYESAEDLRRVLTRMTAPDRLRSFLGSQDLVCLRSDVSARMQGEDLLLEAPFRTVTLPASRHPYATLLAEHLSRPATVGEIALALEEGAGAPLERAFGVLNDLQSLGLLDDEPEWQDAGKRSGRDYPDPSSLDQNSEALKP